MRRRARSWIAACLAIAMSACATFRPPPPPRPDTAKACANWRWIGITRSGAQCPDIPGWTARPLFPQVSPTQRKPEDYWAKKNSEKEDYCKDKSFEKEDYCKEKNSEEVPGPEAIRKKDSEQGIFREKKESEKAPSPEVIRELSRFCVYEVAHKWLKDPKPPKSAELVRLDPDCAALSNSGDTDLEAKTAESSFQRLVAQVGMPAGPVTIANPNSVRLAFLDTEPSREELPTEKEPRHSLHGYTLASIARYLVCQGETCAARITTQLALPIMKFNSKSWILTWRDEGRGGFLGMQSDLADAIRSEVDAWQRDLQRGSLEKHLVLNLSLAWDGELFGGLDEAQIVEMRAGTQAVYRALQYATGFDALVLAAAGNQKSAPCNNFGPLLPAAWERGALQESCGEPRDAPLLYAVGGVGADDSAVVNARPGGMPRRTAYAESGVVPSLDPTRYTATLTGSSVGTAVVSSIAAAVWSAFPGLSSREVMDILDASGDELPIYADFWFGSNVFPASSRPKVHRLSLCTALEAACASPLTAPATCPLAGQCDGQRRRSPVSPAVPKPTKWVPDSCQPWMHPQPEVPPCLSCGPPGG
jgi:hypothetical protein